LAKTITHPAEQFFSAIADHLVLVLFTKCIATAHKGDTKPAGTRNAYFFLIVEWLRRDAIQSVLKTAKMCSHNLTKSAL